MKTSKKAIDNLKDQVVDTNKVQGGDGNKLSSPILERTMQGDDGVGTASRRSDLRAAPSIKTDISEGSRTIIKRK